MTFAASVLSLLLSALCAGCGSGSTTEVTVEGEGRKALFVGNSYLFTQDIPGIVNALSRAAGGDEIAVATIAAPNVALIDHWDAGVARTELEKGGWEWVILQQGPSSTELNRDTLRLATGYFAERAARVGARVAMFSAWPTDERRQDFARAIESYALAAADVGGIMLPVATAWLEAWERQPNLLLYADGLHASPQGAYLAALVIYACLLERTPIGLPARIVTSRGRVIDMTQATATLLQEAAQESLAGRCPQSLQQTR